MTDLQRGPRLSPDRARTLTDQVKRDARALWTQLLDLYEGGAHLALGYASWADYCAAEFEMSDASAYRLLQAARVVGQLPIGSHPANEAQARELARLKEPEAIRETWTAVIEEHGDDVTAADVRAAVDDRQGIAPRPPVPPRTPAEPILADAPFEWPAEPEATPEEKAFYALARQCLVTRFDPGTVAAVAVCPEGDLPGFEALAAWLARFNTALADRVRHPLRIVQ